MSLSPRSSARLLVAVSLVAPGLAALTLPAHAAPAVVPAVSAVAQDVDPGDRESMRQGYLEVLEPALETPIGWTGDLASCTPGAPSAAAQEATLTAVNYFRDLVGVEPVVFNTTLSAKAQKAALMMARNGDLSHDPPSSWDCWTAEGDAAAGESNLSLGITGAAAIAGYMDDDGAGNEIVGHRRWIIDPRQTRMGSGSVQGGGGWQSVANALYVLDSDSWQSTPASTPAYLPWPVAGYVPAQIEPHGRWSLSAREPGTDFSQATVTVNGSAAGITVHPPQEFYGPDTLVWDFDPDFDLGDPDRTYHVVVSDIVVGGVHSDYSYDVTLFDAEASSTGDTDPPTVSKVNKDFSVRLAGFEIGWVVSDPSGVDGVQERQRARTATTPYGAWTSPSLWEAPHSTQWSGLPQGDTRCFSERARDTLGNISEWSGPVCVHTPVDDVTASASTGWRSVEDQALWNGSARTTRKKGATLTVPGAVDVERVGVVATKCPTCGKVGVYVGDTKIGVIGLQGRTTRKRVVVVLPRLTGPLDGPVTVVVESGDKKVQVDGIVVSGSPSD